MVERERDSEAIDKPLAPGRYLRSFAWGAGLYLVLPVDRIELADGHPSASNPVAVERLALPALRAIGWGSYFSLLSAFNIGFRDFNVGSWIYRIQPSRFQLEPLGWVRTVSGLQSLLTLYLLPMWLLT